jgi:hypothetical protein
MVNVKSVRFEMVADPPWMAALDDWRRRQDRIPSRAEAIRTLVSDGIKGGDAAPGLTEAVLTFLRSHSDDVGDSAAIENAADYFTHDFLLARDRFAREVESWREMYPQADLSRIDAILAALK